MSRFLIVHKCDQYTLYDTEKDWQFMGGLLFFIIGTFGVVGLIILWMRLFNYPEFVELFYLQIASYPTVEQAIEAASKIETHEKSLKGTVYKL